MSHDGLSHRAIVQFVSGLRGTKNYQHISGFLAIYPSRTKSLGVAFVKHQLGLIQFRSGSRFKLPCYW